VITKHSESGFSLIELMVSTAILLIISGIVTEALMQMTKAQATIWNRTEMHSGIRGATELLQQEVGQAGRISLPSVIRLAADINPVGGAAPAASDLCDPATPAAAPAVVIGLTSDDVAISPVAGIFAQAGTPHAFMLLTTMDGNNSESILVGAKDAAATPPTITVCFRKPHAMGTVLTAMGAFATGIIPETGVVDGSSSTVLKMYGDINGDGRMVYVEYTCDATDTHNLYRTVTAFDAGVKLAPTDEDILLSNVMPNPDGTPCFGYQPVTMTVQGTDFTFVLDVAVTLTVQTQNVDPVTRQFQTETKALLNVSPRNVFSAFSLASIGYTDRVQSTPVTVTSLLTPL
jgi:prepilin-type N-terminal cleavage/methylation domain-containing protein